ncbi:GNAT family N-acetyltransferase [Clostridium disporicum]|uniref:Acetyltransferase n=1 Tax=Clostridium disporicum TaxID=84024 RepID=A0A174IYD3_9CLOT|nr:GNAT family N-acetyltransferase [Clostridium disporicum]CUO92404.1 acetyltransferase [Clostridium disporicum]
MFDYREFDEMLIQEVKSIYKKESWNAYLKDDEKLIRAFSNSLYILGAFDEDKLIGFIRCVGDGEHILMIQDLIVSPEYQQKGIGTYLFRTIMDKYKDVRMFIVLTDIEDVVDNKFYQSFKLRRLDEFNIVGYMR